MMENPAYDERLDRPRYELIGGETVMLTPEEKAREQLTVKVSLYDDLIIDIR